MESLKDKENVGLPEVGEGVRRRAVVLAADLFFGSKLRRLPGLPCDVVAARDASKFREDDVALVIDLTRPDAFEAVAAWRDGGDRPVSGFVPHVEAELAREAKGAGVDPVWPRSRVAERMPVWLAGVVGGG